VLKKKTEEEENTDASVAVKGETGRATINEETEKERGDLAKYFEKR